MLDFGRLQGEYEVFNLLGCYAAKVGSFLPTFGLNCCPETSETNYPPMLFAALQKIKALSRLLL